MNKSEIIYNQPIIGISDRLRNGKFVLFIEYDIRREDYISRLKATLQEIDFFSMIDSNLVIYKSLHGYHAFSLNIYPDKLIHDIHSLLNYYNLLCKKWYGFKLLNTENYLRISKKYKEEKRPEIIYNQPGTLPISKCHYEIFSELLQFNYNDLDLKYIDLGIKEHQYCIESDKNGLRKK